MSSACLGGNRGGGAELLVHLRDASRVTGGAALLRLELLRRRAGVRAVRVTPRIQHLCAQALDTQLRPAPLAQPAVTALLRMTGDRTEPALMVEHCESAAALVARDRRPLPAVDAQGPGCSCRSRQPTSCPRKSAAHSLPSWLPSARYPRPSHAGRLARPVSGSIQQLTSWPEAPGTARRCAAVHRSRGTSRDCSHREGAHAHTRRRRPMPTGCESALRAAPKQRRRRQSDLGRCC
jgi:hypothetical protein